jgi:hypothetical protein
MRMTHGYDFVTLWNHADQYEGVVETRTWGFCTNENCAHISHDPQTIYYITRIVGKILWEGEFGESLIISGWTARVFFTRYFERGSYEPLMFTEEIVDFDKLLPPKTSAELNRYPKRHKLITEFWDILQKIKDEKSRFSEAANDQNTRTSTPGVEASGQ